MIGRELRPLCTEQKVERMESLLRKCDGRAAIFIFMAVSWAVLAKGVRGLGAQMGVRREMSVRWRSVYC